MSQANVLKPQHISVDGVGLSSAEFQKFVFLCIRLVSIEYVWYARCVEVFRAGERVRERELAAQCHSCLPGQRGSVETPQNDLWF